MHTSQWYFNIIWNDLEKPSLGEYSVKLPDGRTQIVSYQANDNGYRPKIRVVYPEKVFHN